MGRKNRKKSNPQVESQPANSEQKADGNDRRGFHVRVASAIIATLVGVFPLVTGLVVFFDPLRRKSDEEGQKVLVARLSGVPADGKPRRFQVIDERVDAWTLHPPSAVGAVYLRRTSEDQPPEAWSATCPHLGCMVDYKDDQRRYKCPCHDSYFQLDGERIDPEHCPSPRALDSLKVEVSEAGEIYVWYKKFRAGIEKKIAE